MSARRCVHTGVTLPECSCLSCNREKLRRFAPQLAIAQGAAKVPAKTEGRGGEAVKREEQWRAALRCAATVRKARAEVRHALKARRIDIRLALEEPAVQTMPVLELLACLPGRRAPLRASRVNPAADLACRIGRAAWIESETVTVADLSPARRDHLARIARRTAPGYWVIGRRPRAA